MSWKTTALIAAAVLCTGAAAKPVLKAPAAKAAPAKPAPTKPIVSPVANFDARNPVSVMAVLNLGGGKATQLQKDADTVLVGFVSIAANFTLQFEACDGQGRACKAIEFDSLIDLPGPSFAQLNAFNQSSVMCRGYEDKTGKPHVVYSTLVFADAPYEHFRTEMLAWTGCIGEFRNFLKDPNGYLASAP
ncbi:MAG: hypothetical protein JWQ29_986 [Phenylobacterium sp.]|nr:hypothetical protein [Phenylobacterium sp.]